MTENNVAANITKEIAKNVYEDAGHEIVKPTGKLIGLVPRAIRAALAPVEKWVLQREYNVAETEKLLALKLENVDPEKISPPEAYVAVPALQAISYCMDNDELRDMYANLLAKSMTDVVRNGVHPSFVEIIKQLCPDEAKLLRIILRKGIIPTVGMRCEDDNGAGIYLFHMFSEIGESANCDNPLNIEQYFCNLIRLGILEPSPEGSSLTKKEVYNVCKEHSFVVEKQNTYKNHYDSLPNVKITEGYVYITEFGRVFCEICIKE